MKYFLYKYCICLKVTHIGRNYPCLLDPTLGPMTGQNSSTYSTYPSSYGTVAQKIAFQQVRSHIYLKA